MFELDQKDDDSVRLIMKSNSSTAHERIRAHCLYLRSRQFTVIDAAEILDITPRTVINITSNYRDGGLEKAIKNDPKPGRPPVFDDREKCEIVAVVCSDPPEGFDRWTLNLLQSEVERAEIVESISKESLRLILHEHDLKPWQHKMWCIGDMNDDYIECMEDVLDTYSQTYNSQKPVVCIDEKPVILQADVKPPLEGKPGSVKKIDYEYERNGSINVFAMVEPKAGIYINKVTERKAGSDFAELLCDIAEYYPNAKKIQLVMDNYCTHNKNSLVDRFGEKRANQLWSRFDIHYTPIHGSWLNQAEIAIGMYQRQCLGDCRIPDIQTLEKKTLAWNRVINERSVSIDWKFNTDTAREKFGYG